MKKILFFLCFVAFTATVNAQIFGKKSTGNKKEVTPITGSFSLHPDSITIKGKDGALEFCFLDRTNKCLFITSNKTIYDSATSFLPIRIVEGRTFIFEGTAIDPFSRFSKKNLDELSKSLGISLNEYKVVRIFSYGMKEDIPGPSRSAIADTLRPKKRW